jgi:hypothetical protein
MAPSSSASRKGKPATCHVNRPTSPAVGENDKGQGEGPDEVGCPCVVKVDPAQAVRPRQHADGQEHQKGRNPGAFGNLARKDAGHGKQANGEKHDLRWEIQHGCGHQHEYLIGNSQVATEIDGPGFFRPPDRIACPCGWRVPLLSIRTLPKRLVGEEKNCLEEVRMKKLHFAISSNAPRRHVWRKMLGATEVKVDVDSNAEFEQMFKDMWPKALRKLKQICEN